MGKLTITAKGQLTLNKQVLAHLDVRPGDQVEVDTLSSGEVRIRSVRRRPISDIFGMLKAPAGVSPSIEDINEAIAEAGAEAGMGKR